MLIDTGGLQSLFDSSEAHHVQAKQFYWAAQSRVTTNYVLAEYAALAHSRGTPRSHILTFSSEALDDPDLEVVWVDEELHRRAVDLLKRRPDKGYSICDAVSMVLMKDRGITEALTTDKHFVQEGFTRLLE